MKNKNYLFLTDKPTITVIVPIYNVAEYLLDCLNSLKNQTFNDFEVLLIDDGSTDESPDICLQFCSNNKSFKYFSKENGGLSSARNYGIAKAKGKFLAFVDSDDFVENDYLEKMYQAIESSNSDIVISGFNYIDCCVDNYLKSASCSFEITSNLILDKISIWDYYNKNSSLNIITAWSKLYRKELFSDVQFDDGKIFEDELICHKIFDKCEKICLIKSVLYNYRINRNTSIISTFKGSVLDRNSFLFNRIIFFIDHTYPDYIVFPFINRIFNIVITEYKKSQSKLLKKYLLKIRRIISDNKIFVNKRFFIKIKFLNFYLVKLKIDRFFNSVSEYFLKRKISKYNKWFIGSPTYGNLGDHEIARTTKKFLGKDYLEITSDNYLKNKDLYYSFKPASIVIQGGGNCGNVYPFEEEIKQDILKNFTESRVIIFPQTIWFKETNFVEYEKKKFQKVYSSHPDLTICAREKQSYKMFKSLLKGTNILLVPDIVLFNKPKKKIKKISKILFILRNDFEKNNDNNEIVKLLEFCKNNHLKFEITDTTIPIKISIKRRNFHLKKIHKKIKKSSLVITDRLHGMIFAYLNSTPVIAFDNYNRKVSNSYEWIASNRFVLSCDNAINQDLIFDLTKYRRLEFEPLSEKFNIIKLII